MLSILFHYCLEYSGKSKKLVGDRETDNTLAKFFLNGNYSPVVYK